MTLRRRRRAARDGRYRWFETRIDQAPHESARGGVHLISRDVTARKLAQDALRTQTARLESILASMGDGVVVLDAERRLIKINPVARAYIHQEEGEVVSKDWSKQHRAYLLDGVTPFPSEQGPLTRALHGEAVDGVEMMFQDRANILRAFSVTARPLDDAGRAAGCVAIYHDITAQLRAAKELLESEQRCRIIADSSFEGVAITQTGIVIDANANLVNSLGRTPSELVGSVTLDLFAAEDRDLVDEMISESEAMFEAQMLRADGTRFPVEVRGRLATFRGEPVRIVAVREITEKRAREAELKRQSEQLRALSLHDELTGLFNRRGFLEHAEQQLLTAARGERDACLFFVDLDAMKAINDGLGHEAGDRALVATAIVLTSVFRGSDSVARLGGDEFAIFAPECGVADVANMCARLDDAVAAYNDTSGESFQLSMSVGTAVYTPQDKPGLETLMARADAKMYAIKQASGRSTPAPAASGSGRVLTARPSASSTSTARQVSLAADVRSNATRTEDT
jgi:diguanylate cyclase (GGDEF)-like protein/PAS domain S-box-containing protein